MTVSERPPQEREGSLKDRLHAPGNKRILALDGGGVRGALTLQFLARIEAELRVRAGTGDHFRLSDYFDPIAGTSTGAIIATCLALGQSVAEIADRYRTLARKVFRRPFWRLGILGPKFSAKHLRQELASAFPPRGRLGVYSSRVVCSSWQSGLTRRVPGPSTTTRSGSTTNTNAT